MNFAPLAATLLLTATLVPPAHADGLLPLLAQTRWNQLSPEAKEKALENYRAYQSLSPEERGQLDQGYQRWKKLSAEDKKELRDRYRRLQGLSDEERAQMRSRAKDRRRD